MEQTRWIMERIKHYSSAYQCRLAGSESERRCMKEMAGELEGWADTVVTEPFAVHPNAFPASVCMEAGLALLSVCCYWLGGLLNAPWLRVLCPVLCIMAILVWLLEYILYRQVFDFLFAKKTSQNVMAALSPAGETRRRVILCGHGDASHEMPCLFRIPRWLLVLLMALGDGGKLPLLAASLLQLHPAMDAGLWRGLGIVLLCSVPAYVYFLFFINWKVVADGAGDNLSGCLTCMSILKEMKERGVRPEHTEVCCLITGSEESGIRGALAYAKEHRQELCDSDTIVIGVDTLFDEESLMVYGRGINFTQRNDPGVCSLLHQAGRNCGAELPDTGYYPGATDAEGFSRYGIRAASLCGTSQKDTLHYHSRYDTAEALGPDCIAKARKIVWEAVRLFDRDGA